MTNREAVNWLINITADIGKAEHRDLWHYEQALSEIREMLEAQPDPEEFEWCTDCKEYDQDRHCCPKYNRVIRDAVEEAKEERVYCKDCKHRYTDDCSMRFTETVWYDDEGYVDFDEIVTDNTTDDSFCSDGKRREK